MSSEPRIAPAPPVLQAEGIALERGGRGVLEGVELRLGAGEVLGIVGTNGAGKSSLLRVFAGLLPASRGRVLLGGAPLAERSRRELARTLAFLPQELPADLPFTALEVALMGRSPHLGGLGLDGPADRRIAEESLRATASLPLAGRAFSRLSGGERQRVWIARALAQRAPIWLFDEPIAHLDLKQQRLILQLIRRHAEAGGSAVVVLHDLSQVARVCDRVLLLHQGRPLAYGRAREILTPARLESAFDLGFTWARTASGRLLPLPDWE